MCLLQPTGCYLKSIGRRHPPCRHLTLPGAVHEVPRLRSRKAYSGELAFYGGTFTALPSEVIREILETATPWVRAGVFSGFRLSTRPDGISVKTCSLLQDYPVKKIELGVQSLVDEVLLQSRRGYSVATVERAVALGACQGWRLGVQLMLGLPGDSPARFMDSIAQAIQLRPDFCADLSHPGFD